MKTPSKPQPAKKPADTRGQKSADDLTKAARSRPLPTDPLSAASMRSMAKRLGPFILAGWVVAFLIPGWIPKVVVGVITVAIAGLVIWLVRFAQRSRAVAEIVQKADSKESRKEAIEQLEAGFKKDDTAAVFAKAQLQMQEDPRAALATLELIKLDKVMAPVADEARAQRAMIHLVLGEIDETKDLVEKIDMTRHKEPKTRAMLAAIVGEAWGRGGQAKRAVELLETFDSEDAAYEEIRPQLLRARAFAYAWSNDTKKMKATLRKLAAINPQLLSGFITRKKHPQGVAPRGVHPALEKEAFDMARAGAVPRKMEFRRG